jgi:hypothetical protein
MLEFFSVPGLPCSGVEPLRAILRVRLGIAWKFTGAQMHKEIVSP